MDNLGKGDAYWKHAIWSDEKKLNHFGHKDVAYAWRKKEELNNPKYTVSIVKYSEKSTMLWE